MYKITNSYISVIDFSSPGTNFLPNSSFNTFSLNLSSGSQSGNNSNVEQYCIPDKKTLAKAKKNVREKMKAEAKEKKRAEAKVTKEKKRAESEAAKEKKRMEAKAIVRKKMKDRVAKNVEISL